MGCSFRIFWGVRAIQAECFPLKTKFAARLGGELVV